MAVPFLGCVPLYEPVRSGGDTGRPIVLAEPDSPAALAYAAWYRELTRLVYADELDTLFKDSWDQRAGFMIPVMKGERGYERWCDDVRTQAKDGLVPSYWWTTPAYGLWAQAQAGFEPAAAREAARQLLPSSEKQNSSRGKRPSTSSGPAW